MARKRNMKARLFLNLIYTKNTASKKNLKINFQYKKENKSPVIYSKFTERFRVGTWFLWLQSDVIKVYVNSCEFSS